MEIFRNSGIHGQWMLEGSRSPVCTVHYAVAGPGDTLHTSNKCFVAIMAMLGGKMGEPTKHFQVDISTLHWY